jgi:FtsP/CotA-like multicopper oxidase with cupredoxin domain
LGTGRASCRKAFSDCALAPEENLAWKDTVLVKTGETVDILLDVTNPGRWMAHCHIAEHHESGMMFSFNVDEAA